MAKSFFCFARRRHHGKTFQLPSVLGIAVQDGFDIDDHLLFSGDSLEEPVELLFRDGFEDEKPGSDG